MQSFIDSHQPMLDPWVRIVPGEGDPLARVADLAEAREGVTLGVFGLEKDEHTVVVPRPPLTIVAARQSGR
jgi:hypothetical protein